MYSVGGFSLPYFVVGSMALIMAIVLVFVVPKVQTDIKAKQVKQSKSLSEELECLAHLAASQINRSHPRSYLDLFEYIILFSQLSKLNLPFFRSPRN